MSTLTQYLEKQDTLLLESLLEAYCDGREDMHFEVALTICRILARRNRRKPDVDQEFRRMCRLYLP
jgi:hypothetical protein